MPLYEIEHRTHYRYGQPVAVGHHALHVQPLENARQKRRRFALEVLPEGAQVETRLDTFGNVEHLVALHETHHELTLNATATVWVADKPVAWPEAGVTVAELRSLLLRARRGEAPLPEAPHPIRLLDSTYATPLTTPSAELTAWATPLLRAEAPAGAAIRELLAALHRVIAFDAHATEVTTPAASAFARRRGVCQDLAQIALAALRAHGLAAAYVSGYLRTSPPPGQPRLRGADATHAWLACWLPGHGWLGWDPTNDCPVGPHHIEVAHGRDYRDVAPVRGTVIGGAAQTLSVGVTVEEAEAAT